MDYLYDGTFEGLLSCVHAHYYEEKASGIYPEADYQMTAFTPFRVLTADRKKAGKVYNAIYEKMGREGMKLVYRSFLSDTRGKENAVLQYLIRGFKQGKKINGLFTDPSVYALRQMENDVVAESHRLLGLTRFSVIGKLPNPERPERTLPQILYAALEPDHDVIELMGDHFAARYHGEHLIIHDLRREKAVFSRQGSWDIRALPEDFRKKAAAGGWQKEGIYEDLWKQYFRSIAIDERTNAKCQKNYMPVRYRKHLTEFT